VFEIPSTLKIHMASGGGRHLKEGIHSVYDEKN
jgi:hypothetical protein